MRIKESRCRCVSLQCAIPFCRMSSDTPARFPLPASFHGYRQFELFTDYGGVAGLNIVNGDDEIHVHAQKMHYGARTKLVASQPSLPVMPPNCGEYLTSYDKDHGELSCMNVHAHNIMNTDWVVTPQCHICT